MNIYQNLLNSGLYTMRIVEAIPTMMEATPYMTNGQIIKYPVLSNTANDFVSISEQALTAYDNSSK